MDSRFGRGVGRSPPALKCHWAAERLARQAAASVRCIPVRCRLVVLAVAAPSPAHPDSAQAGLPTSVAFPESTR